MGSKRRRLNVLRGPPWPVTILSKPEDIPDVRLSMLEDALAGNGGQPLRAWKSVNGDVLAKFHATVVESAGANFGEPADEFTAPDYLVQERDARAFLTFLYLGALTPECTGADARVLWLLARDHGVHRLACELARTVDRSNFCGAFQFIAQTPHGVLEAQAEQVTSVCMGKACDLTTYNWGSEKMSMDAFASLLQGFLKGAHHPRGRNTLHGFTEASRWLRHNYGTAKIPEDVRKTIMGLFDWSLLPKHAFLTHVKASKLLTETEFYAAIMQFLSLAPPLDQEFPGARSVELYRGRDRVRSVAVLPGAGHAQIVVVKNNAKVVVFKCFLPDINMVHTADIHRLSDGKQHFEIAEAVAIDPSSGDVFVSDCAQKSVLVFDMNGSYKFRIQDAKKIVSPHGVAFNASGNLLVVETVRGCVLEFTKEGAFVREFVPPNTRASLAHPYWVAVNSEGEVAVTDFGGAFFRVYDPKGALVHTEDCVMAGDKCVDGDDIAFGPDGSILVTSKKLNCIFVFGKSPCGAGGYSLTRRVKCDAAHGVALLNDDVVVTTGGKLVFYKYTR